MGRGRNQRIDEDFEKWAKKISEERFLKKIDDDKISIRAVTKKMMKSINFKKLEEDLLR